MTKTLLVVTNDKAEWLKIKNEKSMTSEELIDCDNKKLYADFIMDVKTGIIYKNRKGSKGFMMTDKNRIKIYKLLGLNKVK